MGSSCRKVRRCCSEYLDGDLRGQAAEGIRRHLAECAGCAAFANTLRRTMDLSRQLPGVLVPAAVRRELKTMVRAREGSGRARAPRRRGSLRRGGR